MCRRANSQQDPQGEKSRELRCVSNKPNISGEQNMRWPNNGALINNKADANDKSRSCNIPQSICSGVSQWKCRGRDIYIYYLTGCWRVHVIGCYLMTFIALSRQSDSYAVNYQLYNLICIIYIGYNQLDNRDS